MGLKMNNWQKVINVSLAVIVTLLIYQNQQLQKEVDSVAGFNELDSNAIWSRMDKIEEKAYANKSDIASFKELVELNRTNIQITFENTEKLEEVSDDIRVALNKTINNTNGNQEKIDELIEFLDKVYGD